jgi:hypothetical protein
MRATTPFRKVNAKVLLGNGSDITKAVSAPTAGCRMVGGVTALGGTNPTPIATGLTTIVAAVATLNKTSAPGVGTQSVTTEFATGGTLNLYGWKPTASGDCTLIASTGTENVAWIAWGT